MPSMFSLPRNLPSQVEIIHKAQARFLEPVHFGWCFSQNSSMQCTVTTRLRRCCLSSAPPSSLSSRQRSANLTERMELIGQSHQSNSRAHVDDDSCTLLLHVRDDLLHSDDWTKQGQGRKRSGTCQHQFFSTKV
jgi:hypothetical protein